MLVAEGLLPIVPEMQLAVQVDRPYLVEAGELETLLLPPAQLQLVEQVVQD
jgi:hypothetical protein